MGSNSDMYDNGDKHYRIKLVAEGDLPPDQDFAFAECGGDLWLLLKETRLVAPVLEDAWATYRKLPPTG
jgi:hypothetical protein